MSWMRHFQTPDKIGKMNRETDQMMRSFNSGSSISSSKYSSYLPEVYSGHPQRLDRYVQYDNMDRDDAINMSLDTITETATAPEDENNSDVFNITFDSDPNTAEMEVIRGLLNKWIRINDWRTRIFDTFRTTLKYGDAFFIRDPQTHQLMWVDAYNVEKIIVDNTNGRKPSAYFIRGIAPNMADKVATLPDRYSDTVRATGMAGLASQAATVNPNGSSDMYSAAKGTQSGEIWPVDAAHVVHISLSSGIDANWPFGNSILEPLFKVYKQKELLEDSILIYRIQRAPERRAFYIDVGDMPLQKTGPYLEKVKLESQQRRLPTKTGGGMNVTDARYDPMAMLDDYYFARNTDGRGSSMEIIAGGENLGCFAMNTKIILTDGRKLTIREIERELAAGRQLFTYSCHPTTGHIKKGIISWAGVTRKNAEVWKVSLSNGNSFVATPDHEFPIEGKGFVKLSDLQEGDELIGTKPISDSKLTKFFRWLFARPENVMIRKIKKLKNTQNVGTLTIDENHILHDYHTYALAAGVFAKNSIEDLKYFNNKLIRALRVPSSYIPLGPEDGNAVYTDGRVGTAYFQEYRFSRYCQRLQNSIIRSLDKEFKLFIKQSGYDNVDTSTFDLQFFPPQNFRRYAQIERDSMAVNAFQALQDVPFIAKRVLLERYLGWTEEEIIENERIWKEERAEQVKDVIGSSDSGKAGLDAIGIKPTDQFSFGGNDEPEMDDELNTDIDVDMDLDTEVEDTPEPEE